MTRSIPALLLRVLLADATLPDVVCSRLHYLSDGPIRFAEGDVLGIEGPENESETVTNLDYVLFSPSLYLDNLVCREVSKL